MRIQTPLLVLVAVGISLSFLFPLWTRQVEKEGYTYARVLTIFSYTTFKHPSNDAKQKESVYQQPVAYSGIPHISILCAISAAAALATLFLYGNRQAQTRLCRIHFWILVAILLACFHYVTQVEQAISGNVRGEYTWGAYGIIGALFLNWIASLLIRRDERIVRDADTLR